MEQDRIEGLMDVIASTFVMLNGNEIDIPTAGKLLNAMEEVVGEARVRNMEALAGAARELVALLESIVLERIDPGEGASRFAEGLSSLQAMAHNFIEGEEAAMRGGNVSVQIPAAGEGERLPKEEAGGEGEDDMSRGMRTGADDSDDDAPPFIVQDESLLRDFITESLEYISEIEINILDLEQNPQDKECVNAVFRPFHSIKGVSSFLDLKDIRDTAHELETLLDRVRSGELTMTSGIIDIILEGADMLKLMIGSLQEVLEGTRRRPMAPDMSELREKIDRLEEEGVPPIDEKPVKKLGTILVEDGVITEDILEDALKRPEAKGGKIGQRLIAEGKATPKQVMGALRKQSKQVMETSTVRVDVKKLDDFVDMIGELVITQTMIRQNLLRQKVSDRKLMSDLAQLSSITSELQRTSTSLRMVPIRQTFQRMARLVRDLAKSVGKDVVVMMEGEDTEIDRNMVEEIYNPLVHMVRNSIDHGLETKEERRAKGKPEKGTVRLSAYHKGGNIVIEISDDGRGLNREKILQRARERGLVGESENLSEQEIYKLIFMPGFSTAEKVTDVSGRGVGMDVVKKAVEKLRGKIELRSTEGEGTTFAAFFPLTMAIIDGMTVRVGKEKYIVPATAIRRLLRPGRENYTNVASKGEMLNVMGELLPLVRLYEIFSVEPAYREPWESLVVVIDAGGRSKCVLVDEVLEKGEVVIKSLGGNFQALKGISGGAILGDGNVGLILDPEGLFELAEGQA